MTALLNGSINDRIVTIGRSFYNIRSPFKVLFGLIDVGTHMSLIRLNTGKFIIIDTIEIDIELEHDKILDSKNPDTPRDKQDFKFRMPPSALNCAFK